MSLKKKIDLHINKRPEYKISDEYTDNQAMARAAAFGRDASIQQQEDNIEQSAADAIGMAGQYSNSASGILATLASVSNNKNSALRNLASDEAAIQNQKMLTLYDVNKDLAEEQDKAFEYNVNMPYQKKLEMLQEKRRRRQLMTDSLTGAAIAVGGSAATSGTTQYGGSGSGENNGQGAAMGLLGTILSDERLKKDVADTRYGLNQILELKVKEYSYKHDGDNAQNHIGLMAQNVLENIPEAVDQSGKYLKVNYNEIVPVMIKAIQEQNQKIEELSRKLSELQQPA